MTFHVGTALVAVAPANSGHGSAVGRVLFWVIIGIVVVSLASLLRRRKR